METSGNDAGIHATPQDILHPLYGKWVLWAHLPHDTDCLPLVVKYAVASLGEIKLCLAPLPN